MSVVFAASHDTGVFLGEGYNQPAESQPTFDSGSIKLPASFNPTSLSLVNMPSLGMAANRTYYQAILVNIGAGTPGGKIPLCGFGNDSTGIYPQAQLRADGHLWIEAGASSVDCGALSAGEHVVEFAVRINSASNDTFDAKVDGVTVGSQINAAITTTAMDYAYILVADNNNISGTVGVDISVRQHVIYDDQGATQNTWVGKDLRLKLSNPISDNAVGAGFEAPQTSGSDTTDLWDSLDTWGDGVTHSDVDANNGKYVFNAAANATTNLDENMQSYTTLGLAAADVVEWVQAIATTGQATTSTDTAGAIQVVSNPAQGAETGFAAFDNLIAGTFPTNWRLVKSAVVQGGSPTKGTSPVVRIGKRTAQTRVVMIEALGLIVAYTPASGQSLTVSATCGTSAARGMAAERVRSATSSVAATCSRAVTLARAAVAALTGLRARAPSISRSATSSASSARIAGPGLVRSAAAAGTAVAARGAAKSAAASAPASASSVRGAAATRTASGVLGALVGRAASIIRGAAAPAVGTAEQGQPHALSVTGTTGTSASTLRTAAIGRAASAIATALSSRGPNRQRAATASSAAAARRDASLVRSAPSPSSATSARAVAMGRTAVATIAVARTRAVSAIRAAGSILAGASSRSPSVTRATATSATSASRRDATRAPTATVAAVPASTRGASRAANANVVAAATTGRTAGRVALAASPVVGASARAASAVRTAGSALVAQVALSFRFTASSPAGRLGRLVAGRLGVGRSGRIARGRRGRIEED